MGISEIRKYRKCLNFKFSPTMGRIQIAVVNFFASVVMSTPRTPGMNVVGLGEVLWDVFSPSNRLLGGAPANFAYHSLCMGNNGVVCSSVGRDELGAEALATLESRGVNTGYIQTSSSCPTGTVMVTLSPDGEPSYVIEGGAWDELELTAAWRQLAAETDVVCYGSLAQRSALSRATIRDFIAHTPPSCVRVFDCNLRQKYYEKSVLSSGLAAATIFKLNGEEATPVVMCLDLDGPAGTPATLEECADRLLAAYAGLKLVCITKGAHGVTLVTRDVRVSSLSAAVEVVDTVGAGDAFTAALVHSLLGTAMDRLTEATLTAAAVFASDYAGYVCTQAGATPPPPKWLRV
jgi:fructokinase